MEQHPPTNDELLENAERSLLWARSNYAQIHNDLANTAALLSLAASTLVIARLLGEQTEMMHEIDLPEMGAQPSQQEGQM